MNKKKILLYVAVILLVILIGFLFIKIFDFENEPKKSDNGIPEVTLELVDQLYSYLDIDNPNGIMTMYSNIYTTVNNLSYDVLEKMILNYTINYDTTNLENLTSAELLQENVEGTPLYKIKTAVFNTNLSKLFGNEAKLQFTANFIFQENIRAILSNSGDYYYVYETNEINNNSYKVFKKMDRYLVTDNNATIKIYDYYLKCNIETNICYNDERNRYINNNVKYTEDLNLDNYINYLTTYEHTFKYDNGNYYWVSSNATN